MTNFLNIFTKFTSKSIYATVAPKEYKGLEVHIKKVTQVLRCDWM